MTRLAWRVVPITCDVMPYSPAAHTPGVAHGPPLPGVAGTDCCAYMPHSSATLCRPAHQVSAGSWSAALGPAGGRQAGNWSTVLGPAGGRQAGNWSTALGPAGGRKAGNWSTALGPAGGRQAGNWSTALGPAGGRQACRQAGRLGGGQYIRCKQAGGRPGVSRQELCSPWICRVGAVWGRSGPGLWSEVWGRG